MEKALKVAIYIRVSTEEQAKDGYWLESQERILKAFITANEDKNWITNESLIYRDEWVSWATDVSSRLALSLLEKDILLGKVDVVLVWKIDRLFRHTQSLLSFVEFLQEKWVIFVSKSESIDLSSPSGKLVLTLLWAIAEMERETIKERTREGKKSKALEWYFIYWQLPPYGYKKEFDGRWNKIVIHEEEAEIVKKIFEMYVNEDKTMWEISEYLSSIWAPIRESKKRKHIWRFSSNHISQILKNETYLWNLFCNKTEVKKENGKNVIKDKDFSQWIKIPCPVIIDEKIFKKAQEKISKAKALTSGRWERHFYTGLLKCGICGKSYNYYLTHKKTHQYRCWGKKKDKLAPKNSEAYHICKNPDISEIKLHNAIKPIIKQMLTNAEKFIEEYKWKNWWEKEVERKNNLAWEMEKIAKILENKQELKTRILRKILENPEEENDLQKILDDVKNEVKILEKNYEETKEKLDFLNRKEEWFEAILEVEKIYKNKLENLSEKQWMDLTHKFVDKIYIDEENIRVVMRVGKMDK